MGILPAVFAVAAMLAIIAIVTFLVSAPDWPWMERRQQVPHRVIVAVLLWLLCDNRPIPPTIGGLMVLVGIGLALRPVVRSFAKLDAG
jgi:hypothetical protein